MIDNRQFHHKKVKKKHKIERWNLKKHFFTVFQNVLKILNIIIVLLNKVGSGFATLMQSLANLCKVLQTRANFCKLLQKLANFCKLLQSFANMCKLFAKLCTCLHICKCYAKSCKLLQIVSNFLQNFANLCDSLQNFDFAKSCKILRNCFQLFLKTCAVLEFVSFFSWCFLKSCAHVNDEQNQC